MRRISWSQSALPSRQIGAVGGNIDPAQHDLFHAVFDEGLDLGHHLAGGNGATVAAAIGSMQKVQRVVTAVLDLDEGPHPFAEPLRVAMVRRLDRRHDVIDQNALIGRGAVGFRLELLAVADDAVDLGQGGNRPSGRSAGAAGDQRSRLRGSRDAACGSSGAPAPLRRQIAQVFTTIRSPRPVVRARIASGISKAFRRQPKVTTRLAVHGRLARPQFGLPGEDGRDRAGHDDTAVGRWHAIGSLVRRRPPPCAAARAPHRRYRARPPPLRRRRRTRRPG